VSALAAAPCRALLIDLDGVIRQWPMLDTQLEHDHGLPEGALRRAAFEPGLLRAAITGRISDEQWRASITDQLRQRYPGAAVVQAVAAWSAPVGSVDVMVLDILDRVRTNAAVVLVSNATSRLRHDLATLGIAGRFDAIVNSSDIGAIKPDSAIYVEALRMAGASASEALFVDDSLANVDAARGMGMRALHFRGAAGLAAFLADCRVLSPTC
jgi:putative hydrolase of the HAD superfamily